MKLFCVDKDGGKESTVWAYWLIEWKRFFSIALLRFEDGSRDAFHTHAFTCISWVLSGGLSEQHRSGKVVKHFPSLLPVFTYRNTYHKVTSNGRTWVLTIRGPWAENWKEFRPSEGREVVLANGRKEVA